MPEEQAVGWIEGVAKESTFLVWTMGSTLVAGPRLYTGIRAGVRPYRHCVIAGAPYLSYLR
jgi:hypothetical protein